MYAARVDPPWDLDAWRTQARAALQAGAEPAQIDWSDDAAPSLLAPTPVTALPQVRDAPAVPAEFLASAARVLAHRDPHRHALLYRLLWRLANGEPRLLGNALDADVHRVRELEKAVRRDVHKMKAFVRFRAVPGEHEAYIAWFEPEHHIVDLAAPFFMRRFAGMRWAILTPYRRAIWDGESLQFGGGARPDEAPADDAHEALWQAYYAHIFNPARLNTRMMRQEMPVKYWRHLPEVHRLPTLVREAGQRVREMAERDAQPTRKPAMVARAAKQVAALEGEGDSLAALKAQLPECRACPLWQPATQPVAGEGPADARVMVVGEQPGDQEDLQGHPFVGPAGKLLSRALEAAGIPREQTFVSNAVKHFKFELRGKRRIHKSPTQREIAACQHWLEDEIALVRPGALVALGASAARSLLGRAAPVNANRGQWLPRPDGLEVLVTLHPSALLRVDPEDREAAFEAFVLDLRQARRLFRG
ncbi:MAG TPA: UdgX family uracil-DNA binding protein [Ramlibacter sp.]